MIEISGIGGNKKTFDRIARMKKSMTLGLKRGALLSGKDIRHEIRRKMAAPKHGNTYILQDIWTGRSVRHIASALGEAPARFSGSLKQSVNYIAGAGDLVVGAGTDNGGVGIVYDAGYPGRSGDKIDLSGQIGFGGIVDYALKLETVMGRFYLKVTILEPQKNTFNYLGKSFLRELSK